MHEPAYIQQFGQRRALCAQVAGEQPERATGVDRAELGVVPDQQQFRPGLRGMLVYVRVDQDYTIGFARSDESWDRYDSTDPAELNEIDNDPDGWDILRQRDDDSGSELLERDASMERVLEVIDSDHSMVSDHSPRR